MHLVLYNIIDTYNAHVLPEPGDAFRLTISWVTTSWVTISWVTKSRVKTSWITSSWVTLVGLSSPVPRRLGINEALSSVFNT